MKFELHSKNTEVRCLNRKTFTLLLVKFMNEQNTLQEIQGSPTTQLWSVLENVETFPKNECCYFQ